MYAINPGFRPVHSFEDALARHNKDDGFSKRHGNELKAERAYGQNLHAERALDGRKRHMTLRILNKREKEDLYGRFPYDRTEFETWVSQTHIAFKLYQTDVVVYREDGAVHLTKYPSMSTNMFACLLTPSTIRAVFSITNSGAFSGLDTVTCLDRDDLTKNYYFWDKCNKRRIYDMSHSSRMLFLCTDKATNRYEPHPQDITLWQCPVIDPKDARRVSIETGLTGFSKWASVYAQMQYANGFYRDASDLLVPDVPTLLNWLKDPYAGWPSLMRVVGWWPSQPTYHDAAAQRGWAKQAAMQRYDRWQRDPSYKAVAHVENVVAQVRRIVHKALGVWNTKHIPYFENHRALKRAFYLARSSGRSI